MQPSALNVLLARRVLGLIDGGRAADLATAALAEGSDSPALRELAGMANAVRADTDPLVERIARENPAPELDRARAARIVAAHVARAILNGSIRPDLGAADLDDIWFLAGQPEWITPYLLLEEDEDRTRPNYRSEMEARIRAAASDLLERLSTAP